MKRHKRRWWPWLRRALTLAFFVALAALLASRARSMDWQQVGAALSAYGGSTLLAAALLAAASHLLYSCFDLLGRHYTGHGLGRAQSMSTAFVSYAFNLNLGALVGGVGFRYRIYSRYGLHTGTITQVLGLSMLTNWLGYLPLTGLCLLLGVVRLPEDWRLGEIALRACGALMIAACAGYLWLCARSRRRVWSARGLKLHLPSLRMALLQLLLSAANWLFIGGVVYVLLPDSAHYGQVLATLLVAAIAGVLAHVPAGLGVVEAVFLALLDGVLPESELLAALLAYRAIYYLVPLAVACALYLSLEARARRSRPLPA